MHGKMIVLIPRGDEWKMENFYDEIMYGLGADYIGDRMFGRNAESIYERFTTALNSIDTSKMTVRDSVKHDRDYPVVIIDGVLPSMVFGSCVQYKAYCDFYELSFEDYDWQVWDFHF